MRSRIGWLLLGLAISLESSAETLELFNARTAPEEAWSWSDARARKRGDRVIITEINKQGSLGNVFPERRFPYHPGAELQFECRDMTGGAYSLQVMAFAGDTPIGTLDLIKESATGGRHIFRLAERGLDPKTQSILFMVGVGGVVGATVELDELRYMIEFPAENIAFDERFVAPGRWTPEHASLAQGSSGLVLSLQTGHAYGNLLLDSLLARDDASWLLLHAPTVSAGTLTIQVVAFDDQGQYLSSVDAVPAVSAGWHGVRLGQLDWPAGATQFKVKFWLGGSPGANATIARVLLLTDGATARSTSSPSSR